MATFDALLRKNISTLNLSGLGFLAVSLEKTPISPLTAQVFYPDLSTVSRAYRT